MRKRRFSDCGWVSLTLDRPAELRSGNKEKSTLSIRWPVLLIVEFNVSEMTSCFSKHTSGSRLKHLWLWLEEWSGNAAPPPVRWVLSDLQTCVSCLNNTKKYMRNHRCPALFDVWQHPFSRVVYTLILHLTRLQHYPTSTEIRAQIEPCIYNRVSFSCKHKWNQHNRGLCAS